MMISYTTLQEIDCKVGDRRGWDFSRVCDDRDPTPWDYVQVVKKYLKPQDHVLDVGTGGGETFLSLVPHLHSGVGVDISSQMIATAIDNTPPELSAKVRFQVMDGYALAFADASFDIILNRHSSLDVGEITRLLKPGGYLITQQVGRRNTANIYAAFGSSMAEDWAGELDGSVFDLQGQFARAGCRTICVAEYDVPYFFCDIESFVFWLRAVPVPRDFEMKRHWQAVQTSIETFMTSRGIETNEHRELLIVQRIDY